MGSSSSIEKVYQLPNEEKSNKKRLSRTDIQIVRKSWKEMGNFKTNGLNMMIKIFMKHENIRHLWKFTVNLKTEEEMRKSPQIKSHGNKVFEAINAAIVSLDKPDVLNTILTALGERHKGYGSKIEHFPVIRNAFLETLEESLGHKYTEEVEHAWRRVFEYFEVKITEGLENLEKEDEKE